MTESSKGPLKGLRVIDFATFIAAPFAATMLAEFGAEVIKVELPEVGDPCRRFGTQSECGDTLVWLSEGRNKKSVTLDVRKPEGAEIFRKLVKDADIVCQNFQPGTMERWGIGYETLRADNPGLIVLSISGYGKTGPYRDRPGFGRIGNAFGGLTFLAGDPDRPPVTPGSSTLADYQAGLFGFAGLMLALRARDQSGLGQEVDLGLYEGVFRILDELAPAFEKFGFVRQRAGASGGRAVPHSHYPTRDGRWVAIACTTDTIFERLTLVMNRPDLTDPNGLGKMEARVQQRAYVDGLVAEWTSSLTRAEVIESCDRGQVPCGSVYSIDEIFEDPQYRARGNLRTVHDPRVGKITVPNIVPQLSDTPGLIESLGPALGQHNDEIYRGKLGLSDHELELLRSAKVI